MNIQEAKQIPLQVVVERLGGRYSHTDRRGDFWYFSPFRPEEKTASFKISEKYNNWHDFGQAGSITRNGKALQGSGGDVLDLWCDYHQKDRKQGVKEALQGLADLESLARRGEGLQHQQRRDKPALQFEQPRYKILKIVDRITFIGLKEELHRRRISFELANLYLKQGYILDTVTGKKYNGFLFENDKGGYEVSIPNPKQQECFKTCIGSKAITTEKPFKEMDKADVFEGFWDFLSWLEMKKLKTPLHYSFILNSTSLAADACERIINMKELVSGIYLFMDNDEAGYRATHTLAGMLEQYNFKLGSMEQLYDGYKDLNEFHMRKDFKRLISNNIALLP